MRSPLRTWIGPLANTPLHPQWLVRSRAVTREHLAAVAAGVVLDIGSADRWAERELPGGCTYYALDHPAAGGYQTRPDVFGDGSALPLRDSCVDTLLLLEVLEHLPKPRRALAEIARVLRPGGYLVLSMPFLYPIHDAPFDYQRYTEHGLRNALESAGLEVLDVRNSPSAIETAGLVMCLALSGAAAGALQKGGVRLVSLPLIAVLVPLINASSWCLARILPGWQGMAAGYDVLARRM